MVDRYLPPRAAFVGEVVLFTVPTAIAVLRFDFSSLWKYAVTVFLLVGCAAVGKYYLVYAPRVSFEEAKRTSFLDHHLELVVSDFQRRFDTDYDVRVNVMKPQRRRNVTQDDDGVSVETERFLKIAYCAGGGDECDLPAHDGTGPDETDTEWRVNPPPVQGNCGRAYTTGEPRVAGREASQTEWDSETTQRQDRTTEAVNSVLSVPVRKPSSQGPVAVLNLDAAVPLEETNFEDESVQAVVQQEYADEVGALL